MWKLCAWIYKKQHKSRFSLKKKKECWVKSVYKKKKKNKKTRPNPCFDNSIDTIIPLLLLNINICSTIIYFDKAIIINKGIFMALPLPYWLLGRLVTQHYLRCFKSIKDFFFFKNKVCLFYYFFFFFFHLFYFFFFFFFFLKKKFLLLIIQNLIMVHLITNQQ
jgi:hypothetical protein